MFQIFSTGQILNGNGSGAGLVSGGATFQNCDILYLERRSAHTFLFPLMCLQKNLTLYFKLVKVISLISVIRVGTSCGGLIDHLYYRFIVTENYDSSVAEPMGP